MHVVALTRRVLFGWQQHHHYTQLRTQLGATCLLSRLISSLYISYPRSGMWLICVACDE